MTKIEKGEGYVPTFEEVLDREKVTFLRRLLLAYIAAKDKAKSIEEQLDGNKKLGLVGIKPQIIEVLHDCGEDKLRDGDLQIALISQTRKSLSKELLLGAGVPQETLDRCMVESSFETLRVTG